MPIEQSEWDAVARERETPEAATPPVQEAPPAEQHQEEGQQTDPPVDPYEGLHPDVRAKLERFDQIVATVPDLVNGLKEARGRIGALQSEWSKAKAAGPSQTQISAAVKDPEKWASLKSDFPEWGEGITEYVESRLGSLAGSGLTAEQIEQLVTQKAGERTAELERTFSERLVEFKHPGWKKEVNTSDFAAWLAVQPDQTKALANSSDPLDAIAMLDSYAAHKAKPVQQVQQGRQQRLANAVTTTRSNPAPVTKTFDQMSPAEQWDYLASQREKR